MTPSTPLRPSNAIHYLSLFLCLTLTSCGSFPKGVRLLKQQEFSKAKEKFEKSLKHPTFGIGAKYYLGRLKINKKPNTLSWLDIHQVFCELQEEVKQLPPNRILKLRKYDAARPDIMQSQEKLQKRIISRMSKQGTIPELLALEASAACWADPTIDSLRTIIVNKSINPLQEVYDTKEDKEWVVKPISLPTIEEISSEAGRSCKAISDGFKWNINYEDATVIAEKYAHKVLPQNYPQFWEIQTEIWRIFQVHHSYCEMDRFKSEYPNDPIAEDCWFEPARDTLCLSQLRPLLAFHRNNPYTALDPTICVQVLCIANFASDREDLNMEEQQQLQDIEQMYHLQRQLLNCDLQLDSMEFITQVASLAKEYKHHRVVYDLAATTVDYFASKSQYTTARAALETFQPLFPDTSSCPTNFYFQVEKQDWFNLMSDLLDRTDSEKIVPLPVAEWNTTTHNESSLISWGETDEVFFVRRSRKDLSAQVMTSKLEKGIWTKPVPVKELNVADDVSLLSLSAGGRLMLLKAGGKLLRSYRADIGRKWLKPEVMSMNGRFAGNAWLSPDDSLLMVEYYATSAKANRPPKVDLAVSKLKNDGNYGPASPLAANTNLLLSNEGNPLMALGGRLLFFTSDRKSGLGGNDMYSVSLRNPRDWSTMSEPLNLGLPLNTFFEEDGLTYFSEYTGKAYFDRRDRCSVDRDIWEVVLGSGTFPENAMRLAGLVLDENRQAIGGGFMEFTPNYQLNVHSQPISSKGTYTYTVADSTAVVRLFPEIPGYYSENDTTHFLSHATKGQIIRDTFFLTSFDYIRKHFKLVHSTFFNGIAEFDKPDKAYPEITRLAKIATRMGADLELVGHTDEIGTGIDNKKLSFDRANSVKKFLVEKCGFDAQRITVLGLGSTKPICANDTEEGRRCNRRVEITFKMPNQRGKR